MHLTILTTPFAGQSMSFKDGDILLVRLPDGTHPDEGRDILGRILNAIRTIDNIQIHVLACIGDYEVEHLDENEMRKYGWVRADGTD